jgi:hypothetical protein
MLKDEIKKFIFNNRNNLKFKKVKNNSLYNSLLKQTKTNKTTKNYMSNSILLIESRLHLLFDNNDNNDIQDHQSKLLIERKLIKWFDYFKQGDNKDFIVYSLIPNSEDISIPSTAFYKAVKGDLNGICTFICINAWKKYIL